jgi:tetratricopeptide (TPR) repeat protein
MSDDGPHAEAGAYVWSIYALIWIQRGDFSRARHANQRALERIREVGDFNLEFEVWQTRSALNICSGNFGEAEAAWTRTRDLSRRKGNPQGTCWSLLDEVETRVGRGEDNAAARALDAALAIPVAETDGGTNIEIHFATALVRARQDRFEEAIAAADAVVDMVASRAPTGFHWADFCASSVDVYLDVLERGKPEGAARAELEKKAARGCKVVRRVSRQFGNVRPRRWLLSGLLEWERGNGDSALAHLRRAEETAARMDMPFERARARYEIARRGGAGAQRASYLEDAARTFHSLGAGLMLARVRDAQGV